MRAEEYLNDQHAYYEVLKDKGVLRVVHSIMEQYASLKKSEWCEKQREICVRNWIEIKEKLTKEGKDNINAQFTSIVSAPEPEDER